MMKWIALVAMLFVHSAGYADPSFATDAKKLQKAGDNTTKAFSELAQTIQKRVDELEDMIPDLVMIQRLEDPTKVQRIEEAKNLIQKLKDYIVSLEHPLRIPRGENTEAENTPSEPKKVIYSGFLIPSLTNPSITSN